MTYIKYYIGKYNNKSDKPGDYAVWKEVQLEHGIGVKSVFQGTKKECEKELKRIKSSEEV